MQRVVIVGGGFGGLCVARRLVRKVARDAVEIVVIDAHKAHVYTPWLYEVATAVSARGKKGLLKRAGKRAEVPFAQMPGFSGVRFLEGKVKDIARDGSHVVLEDGNTLRADALVIATGSMTNDFGIPGVATYASPLKTTPEAEHIARELGRIYTEVYEGRLPRATVVVAGAGANGVELMGEIAAVRNAFFRARTSDATRVRLVLCDAAPEPVNMFHKVVRRRVAKRLASLGVEFFGNTALREVAPGELHALHVSLPFDLLIWSAGVKSRSEMGEVWGLPVNERGRVRVQETFLVEGRKNMFALGDAAARGATPDPQSAQAAEAQAEVVAHNVLALVQGQPLIPFRPQAWQTLLAVGGSFGVGRVYGIPVQGRGAFWLRRLVDMKYFLSILPAHAALKVWYRGVEAYGKNDDPRS